MPTLGAADYPAIRMELDKDLDATSLNDGVISYRIQDAEEEVVQRAGQYSALDARGKVHWKKAAILLVAAAIAPTITAIPYTATNGSYDYMKFDGKAHAARLLLMAEEELLEISDEDAANPIASDEMQMVEIDTGLSLYG